MEQVLRELREDAADYRKEQERTRQRLHTLESTVKGLVIQNDVAAAESQRRQRRLELRIQVLTFVVAAMTMVALVVPIVRHG